MFFVNRSEILCAATWRSHWMYTHVFIIHSRFVISYLYLWRKKESIFELLFSCFAYFLFILPPSSLQAVSTTYTNSPMNTYLKHFVKAYNCVCWMKSTSIDGLDVPYIRPWLWLPLLLNKDCEAKGLPLEFFDSLFLLPIITTVWN